MKNIVIFGGTTEGRELAQWCDKNNIRVYVSVVSRYGANLLPASENIIIHEGKMDEKEIYCFLQNNNINTVIDATHPYAENATENIKLACEKCKAKTNYYRVVRNMPEKLPDAMYFDTMDEIAAYLEDTEGIVFITTGSKELKKMCTLKDYAKRCALRILDSKEVFDECVRMGFNANMIVCGKGPFSVEENVRTIGSFNAQYLITKESGAAGGFNEKIEAGRICKTKILIIRRPEETGVTADAMKKILQGTVIKVIGIGMDAESTLTLRAAQAIENAGVIIGAKRMISMAKGHIRTDKVFESYDSQKIAEYIEMSEEKNYAVLMSGDTGFYSGAEALLTALRGYDAEIINGISSPVYFAGRIGITWQDMNFVSLHGSGANIVREVCRNKKTFFLLGGNITPADICRKLSEYMLGAAKVYIGENLSMESEKIYEGEAKDYTDISVGGLCVMAVINPDFEKNVRSMIPDCEFIRGNIPMTKAEVRSICVSKMDIKNDDVCWDIGCGTGSVSVEMALRCDKGKVIAIDKSDDAVRLTDQNRHKFKCDNINIVTGNAAEMAAGFECPDAVFVGGSGGRLKEIVETAYEKNSEVRIVITAVSVETVMAAADILSNMGIHYDMTQIAVTRTRKAGKHTMFEAQNPIFVIST